MKTKRSLMHRLRLAWLVLNNFSLVMDLRFEVDGTDVNLFFPRRSITENLQAGWLKPEVRVFAHHGCTDTSCETLQQQAKDRTSANG